MASPFILGDISLVYSLNSLSSLPISTFEQLNRMFRIAWDAQASSLSWFANHTCSAAGSLKSAGRCVSLRQRKQKTKPYGWRWSTAQGSISYTSTISRCLTPSLRVKDVKTPGSDSMTANGPPTRSICPLESSFIAVSKEAESSWTLDVEAMKERSKYVRPSDRYTGN